MSHTHGHHDHHHDHDHHDHGAHGRGLLDGADQPVSAREQEELLDPAQQSLSDALRVMFMLLKLVMLLAVAGFALSNYYTVGSGEVAVRLMLGKIVGEGRAEQVIRSEGTGGARPYFALPYPIMQVVKIPTTSRLITLSKSFWFDTTGNPEGRRGPLEPVRNGSLLTGDANLVHARWTVRYQIKDPVAYIRNVADPSTPERLIEMGDRLVERAAEQAVVFTAAQLTADQIQRGLRGSDYDLARRRMQQSLDDVDSGIEVLEVATSETVFPVDVREAFMAVIKAENERARQIEEAQKERARILGETAGEAYEPLLALIGQYEAATTLGDTRQIAEVDGRIDLAFGGLSVPAEGGAVAIGGKVAETINDALVYRTQTVKRTQSEADYFALLKKEYDANPRVVTDRLWQDAVQEALGQDVEMILVPGKWQPYVEINRDPQKWREREEKRLQQQSGQRPQP